MQGLHLITVSLVSYLNNKETATLSTSTGCNLEVDASYPDIASVNSGETKPDMDSCRILCQSYNAKYFVWRGPTSGAASTQLKCWCKNELRKDLKKISQGVFTGDTECNGQ